MTEPEGGNVTATASQGIVTTEALGRVHNQQLFGVTTVAEVKPKNTVLA